MGTWTAGDWYDKYMGRWSRPIAQKFPTWLDVDTGVAWLDVGCGTGAPTGTIAAQAAPRGLAGVDTIALTTPTTFQSFDDFWEPLLGGQGPAPSHVTSLNEPDRDRLRIS